MTSRLYALRRHPQPTPSQFVNHQPGCFIQYFDDTPMRDPAKALSARSFDPETAQRKQREHCCVCFSLQAFGAARTKEHLLCYRNMGVDIDLVSAADRRRLTLEQIDQRKEKYLERRLFAFRLKPHWLIETRHGFHAIFRVQPQRSEQGIHEASRGNERLVDVLGGDRNATSLTQVMRVPGTSQFKIPHEPFRCRLLIDNSATIVPYSLDAVRSAVSAWEQRHGLLQRGQSVRALPHVATAWRNGIAGVPVGHRNTAAASLIGGILGRLPEYLWDAAGWGGLKEWNLHNAVPLPERELRSVFASIARRERAKRKARHGNSNRSTCRSAVAKSEVCRTPCITNVRSPRIAGPTTSQVSRGFQ
jgi:hypothetical protein